MAGEQQHMNLDPSKLVPRPNEVLRGLSSTDQWEVTRRHPYYLLYWESSRRLQEGQIEDDGLRSLYEIMAMILQLIGVVSEYPDPKTPCDQMNKGMQPAWISGAIAPVTFRMLLALMATQFPESAREVGRMILTTCWGPETEDSPRRDLIQRWVRWQKPEIDACLPSFLSFNLNAPMDEILRSVETQIREWKKQAKIPNRRRRADKASDYLTVWDLREGWCGGDYDPRREKTFKEIAKELKQSISTIRNHYQGAFRLIVGHDYSPELWDRLFGAYKISSFGAGHASLARPRSSRRESVIRQVSISDIGPDTDMDQFADLSGCDTAHLESTGDEEALLTRIRDLITDGKSNFEIIEELDLSNSMANQLVDWVRQHPNGSL